jgi:hypothetical protein
MPKTNEELVKELSGQLSIYKEEIRRLNQAILRKNHSNDKLRQKLNTLEIENESLRQDDDSWGDSWEDEEMKALSPEEALWIDGVSENPDAGKV